MTGAGHADVAPHEHLFSVTVWWSHVAATAAVRELILQTFKPASNADPPLHCELQRESDRATNS